MKNSKINKVCIINGSSWEQKLIEVAYETGLLGGVVESDLRKFKRIFEKYPGITLHTNVEKALDEGYDYFVLDVSHKNNLSIFRYLVKNKKNVLVKKVLSVSPDNIPELIEVIDSSESKIMFGNSLEFYYIVDELKDIIAKGHIGRIESVFSYRFDNSASGKYDNDLSFTVKEETVIINQLKYLISEQVEKIYSYYNLGTPNEIAERIYMSPKFSKSLFQHFFISYQTFSNFEIFIIGSKGLIIIKNINGRYKLTHSSRYNCIAFRIWQPRKKKKNINYLIKEELELFIGKKVTQEKTEKVEIPSKVYQNSLPLSSGIAKRV